MIINHLQISRSYSLAKKYLKNINDPVGSSILEHSFRVYTRLFQEFDLHDKTTQNHLDILSAALLHDILEDSKCDPAEIVKNTNLVVSKLVKELTISFDNKSIKKAVHKYKQISFDAYLIKLADMVDNTQKTQFFIKINGTKWYQDFYFPLCNEYSRFNDIQINAMRTKNYKYSDLAIKLRVIFNKQYGSLKRLVEIWDNINSYTQSCDLV